MKKTDTMPLICLRCKKDIPLTLGTMEEVSYTHYSYCEDCLREGLKLLDKPVPTRERQKQKFRKEVKELVKCHLDEINHYVSGCNSPFSDLQIGMVQEYLNDIREELGIKEE